MSLRLEWSVRAVRELLDIPSWKDAAWIAAEVQRYSEHGVGDVRRARLADGLSEPILFLAGRYRVALLFDRTTRTLWVRSVFRAPRAG